MGNPPSNVQSAGITDTMFDNVGIFGGPSSPNDACSAFVTLDGGFIRNFHFINLNVATFKYGVNWANSNGTLSIDQGSISSTSISGLVAGGNGVLTATGIYYINYTTSSRLLTGNMNGGLGSVQIFGNYFRVDVAPSDDYIIDFQGNLMLEGNYFQSQSGHVPKVRLGTLVNMIVGSGIYGAISMGNQYTNATGAVPFYDQSNTPITYGQSPQKNVMSIADMGSTNGTPVALANWVGFLH